MLRFSAILTPINAHPKAKKQPADMSDTRLYAAWRHEDRIYGSGVKAKTFEDSKLTPYVVTGSDLDVLSLRLEEHAKRSIEEILELEKQGSQIRQQISALQAELKMNEDQIGQKAIEIQQEQRAVVSRFIEENKAAVQEVPLMPGRLGRWKHQLEKRFYSLLDRKKAE